MGRRKERGKGRGGKISLPRSFLKVGANNRKDDHTDATQAESY